MKGLLRNLTSPIRIPLSGPGGEVQTYAHGGTLTFRLDNVPAATNRSLCNYLAGIEIEVAGTLNASDSGSSTVEFQHWDMYSCLFNDVELSGCWHGTPINSNVWKGSIWPLLEWLALGGRFYDVFQKEWGYNAAGQAYRQRMFLPLMRGYMTKSHHCALPAVLYRNGELKLNMAPATAITTILTAGTFASGSVRASAIVMPQNEVYLGAPTEYVDYQVPYAANQEVLSLNTFGNTTALTGTEGGAGLLGLYWLAASAAGLCRFPGAGSVANLTRIAMPFRDQPPTTDVLGFVRAFANAFDLQRGAYEGSQASGTPVAMGDFPFPRSWDTSSLTNAAIMPLVWPNREFELSKVQTVDAAAQLYLAISSGSGTHHVIGDHVRSWTPAAFEDFKRIARDSGLAASVVGTPDVDYLPKLKNKQFPGTPNGKKLRYLPQKLYPAAEVKQVTG